MNGFKRFVIVISLGLLLASAGDKTNQDEQKLQANVDRLIKKLPDQFEFYLHRTYPNPPEQAAADFCRYDWTAIGRDYRQGRVSRASLHILWDEEERECRYFPSYDRDDDSARELLIHQAALKKAFGDSELIRLWSKCMPAYHEGYFYSELLHLPRERLHAYIDDCLDAGVPFQIWNGAYTRDEYEIYAELSNYITTKFLVSSDRLLNAIMYTYTSVFSMGTIAILYDQDLTDKVFQIDNRAQILSLNIIYNHLLSYKIAGLSQAALEKLDRLSFSILRQFPDAPLHDPPFMTSVPARTIQKLIVSGYYNAEQVERMTQDADLRRIGFMVEVDKTFGDYFKSRGDFAKALAFYQKYYEYIEFNRDNYFKEIVDANMCICELGLGRIVPDCVGRINDYVTKLDQKVEQQRMDNVSDASIRDLARLTVLQQDTINLNAKIRWYFSSVVAFACLMLLLSFFLFRSQRDLRRKNALIAEQKASIQQILDEIADVIVKFNRFGQALPYSSQVAVKIFPDIETLTIQQWVESYFELPKDRIRMIQDVLRSVLNEPSVSWDLNSDHLPREATIRGQIWSIDWTPIEREGLIWEILISARNLSHVHEMEALRVEQELILTLVNGGPNLGPWLRALPDRLRALPDLTDTTELARRLHTMKGEARTLHLAPIVDSVHRLENVLREGTAFSHALEPLQAAAARAVEALDRLGQRQDAPLIHENILTIMERIQREAREAVAPKQLRLELTVAGTIAEAATHERLGEILLHAVNNSLDHGFIRPMAAGRTVAEEVRIEVRVEGDEARFRVLIRDNGVGIDEQRLRELAKARAWQPAPGRPWSDVLFEAGVSTSDTITDRSGRGVGLAALRAAAAELGLQPRLENRQDGSSGIELILE